MRYTLLIFTLLSLDANSAVSDTLRKKNFLIAIEPQVSFVIPAERNFSIVSTMNGEDGSFSENFRGVNKVAFNPGLTLTLSLKKNKLDYNFLVQANSIYKKTVMTGKYENSICFPSTPTFVGEVNITESYRILSAGFGITLKHKSIRFSNSISLVWVLYSKVKRVENNFLDNTQSGWQSRRYFPFGLLQSRHTIGVFVFKDRVALNCGVQCYYLTDKTADINRFIPVLSCSISL